MTSIGVRSRATFDYANFDPAAIHLEDIIFPLSTEQRYANQLPGGKTWTVFQHSCLVEGLCSMGCWREALLHDATEAYMRDLPTPLKQLLPDYQRIERELDLVIRKKFNLPEEMSKEVKQADRWALKIEAAMFWRDPNTGRLDAIWEPALGSNFVSNPQLTELEKYSFSVAAEASPAKILSFLKSQSPL